MTKLITLLTTGVTYMRPLRKTMSRVISYKASYNWLLGPMLKGSQVPKYGVYNIWFLYLGILVRVLGICPVFGYLDP